MQRYVELFRSNKGEMMAAVNQRMYGMFGGGAASAGMGARVSPNDVLALWNQHLDLMLGG